MRPRPPRTPDGVDLRPASERVGRASGTGAARTRGRHHPCRLARGEPDRDLLHRIRRGPAAHPGRLRPAGFRLLDPGRGRGGLGGPSAHAGGPPDRSHAGSRSAVPPAGRAGGGGGRSGRRTRLPRCQLPRGPLDAGGGTGVPRALAPACRTSLRRRRGRPARFRAGRGSRSHRGRTPRSRGAGHCRAHAG